MAAPDDANTSQPAAPSAAGPLNAGADVSTSMPIDATSPALMLALLGGAAVLLLVCCCVLDSHCQHRYGVSMLSWACLLPSLAFNGITGLMTVSPNAVQADAGVEIPKWRPWRQRPHRFHDGYA